MELGELRELAADHRRLRHNPHEVAHALEWAVDTIDRMRSAITVMLDNTDRWLETGEPAGSRESLAIYVLLCQSVGRKPVDYCAEDFE